MRKRGGREGRRREEERIEKKREENRKERPKWASYRQTLWEAGNKS